MLLLQELLQWERRISGLKFRNLRTNVVKRTLPFKEGWLISIRAVTELIGELFDSNENLSFILMRRLNQDPLEVSQYLGE